MSVRFSDCVTLWHRIFGPDAWPGVQLFQALAEKFLSGVDRVAPRELERLHGRPVLFLANHQVALESMLFSFAMWPLHGTPTVALAKTDHRDSWIGRLADLAYAYPGVRDRPPIEHLDRDNPDDIVRVIAALERRANLERCSVLVHVEGTRRRSARRGGVQTLSPLWPELAVKNGWPIVPVRFVGGLPVEDLGYRLDVPVGFGSQTIRVGAPILPEDLAGLPDDQRVNRVRSAINALSDNTLEQPEAPDPAFAAEVQAWVERTGAEPMAATVMCALLRHHRELRPGHAGGPVVEPVVDTLVEAAEATLAGAGRVAVQAPPGVATAWMASFARFLFGPGGSPELGAHESLESQIIAGLAPVAAFRTS